MEFTPHLSKPTQEVIFSRLSHLNVFFNQARATCSSSQNFLHCAISGISQIKLYGELCLDCLKLRTLV